MISANSIFDVYTAERESKSHAKATRRDATRRDAFSRCLTWQKDWLPFLRVCCFRVAMSNLVSKLYEARIIEVANIASIFFKQLLLASEPSNLDAHPTRQIERRSAV